MERRRLYNWLSMLSLVIRLGLGCLFLWSSLSKIQLPHDFLGHVYDYRFVGPVLGMSVAMVLPWLELLVGTCLLSGVFVGGALLATLGMGMLFTFVLGSALWRHLDISCGCFSSSTAGQVSYMTLIRAITMTLFSAAAYGATIFPQPREWQPAAPKPVNNLRARRLPNDTGLVSLVRSPRPLDPGRQCPTGGLAGVDERAERLLSGTRHPFGNNDPHKG